MPKSNLKQSHIILALNTLAFTMCFACWTLNGVLVTYLVENGIFDFSVVEIGWLLGIPVLTGSLLRLPVGIMTDKFGGKKVFIILLIFCSIPLFILPLAKSFLAFAILSFLFGIVGTSFAVGVGYTSVWYPKEWQGRALGIFGMGNAGAAITTFLAPTLLNYLSKNNPENGWKILPLIYGFTLIVLSILYILLAKNKKPQGSSKTMSSLLSPLKKGRVWRFGLYYLLVFGFFVAYSQWLVPNFMNVYNTTLVMAGMFASFFSLPSGVVRAFGGYLSDKYGARKVMYWVLGSSVAFSFLLMFPKMDIYTQGQGILSTNAGTITHIDKDKILVNNKEYKVKNKEEEVPKDQTRFLPEKNTWQEILVKENQKVNKKELLAKGITEIRFEANMWMYLALVIFIGISWGIGKAAVYKHIPEYFPNEVGVVGGMVGLIGGLGGFIGPIIFGYLLNCTGLWTSSWMFIFIISLLCLICMHRVIVKMNKEKMPEIFKDIEKK
ncbi:NarK/NasA family nitrate transporter [Apibacter muscae]|uniref:MFS transporter n=1 Tax=Apibacter muscae TaxID=2509004 RepID=UPI0011AC4EA2|nr:MFS transporter [Apibacter muscae]TWP23764.1 NarK/NasA family nitrate transporter [Apibacter muscae]